LSIGGFGGDVVVFTESDAREQRRDQEFVLNVSPTTTTTSPPRRVISNAQRPRGPRTRRAGGTSSRARSPGRQSADDSDDHLAPNSGRR
jgi:hypothetical protein